MLTDPKPETESPNGLVKHDFQPPVVAKPPRRRPKWWAIALLALGILAVPMVAHRVYHRKPNSLQMVEALTVPVEAKDLTVTVRASGVVQPVRRVNLSPKTQGRLAQLYVEQGDRVEAGQIIARMESNELEAQRLQAQARLERTQANLAKLRQGSRPEAIASARARLERAIARLAELQAGTRQEEIAVASARLREAEIRLFDARSGSLQNEIDQAQSRIQANLAELELAQGRVQRYEELKSQGAVSEDTLDGYRRDQRRLEALQDEAKQRLAQLQENRRSQIERLEATVEQERQNLQQLQNGTRPEVIRQAESDVTEARSQLNELENGTRPEDIAAAEADVREAESQLRYYQVLLEDTNIRAPFAGIITQRYAVEGAFVTPATSASDASSATSTSIVALAKDLEVLAKIPETDIVQIEPLQKVEIVADAYPDQVFEGAVHLIAPEAIKERDVTLFQARIDIRTGQDVLQSGMNVNLRFVGRQLNQAVVVPTVAIITNRGNTGVLIPNQEGQPEFKPVTIGSQIGNEIQILQGVTTGDRVFIELPPGQKLEDIIQ
ncbi:efflux RND transporter periplasmic adaptor subunit [Limnospira fusiformis KN01]|uniref:Efflux transporter, RND family, MFP subunit n=2 Tax=Limnospira TaxID=2596745 RepID=B5W9G2_LIMMA|nr:MULTISPECIES: efflux RND transporter periplasmic adaptor subunit [Limnospira]EKD07151.1 efflux transporter RND family MFP subunit [Arthrospira platensis C1]MDC0839090.1 efflux RND transporter periplasmic adaptor subunit [Limnoraphis robusta]MDY7052152.1 efflux RND transporter periplasmic adaptor subunit [Limnospira fusiformis LS22]QJB26128.1 efflux RND transporter periplasmic adaptor subunit [Limnospira fusiformis SAG 85.79]EDZ91848.1 efflux transporter, RND family, MFP subunit [Limnospira 